MSPHRDDAAFSCAIAIRSLQFSCSVIVANCFTASEYAPFRSSDQIPVSELRLREDEAFAAFSGVALQDLDLVDAPERLSIGVSGISTTRPLDAADFVQRDRIARHILSLEPDLIFAPLAMGDHIDHRIAQAAAISCGAAALAFYEDLPYVARLSSDAAETRARELNLGLIATYFSTTAARNWKAQCVSLYPSQVDTNTVDEIAGFCDRYGGRERVWLTPESLNLWKKGETRE